MHIEFHPISSLSFSLSRYIHLLRTSTLSYPQYPNTPHKTRQNVLLTDFHQHADINNLAVYLAVDLLKSGRKVLVSDADVTWMQNPMPFLQGAGLRRDFIGMLAPTWKANGPVNTGLVYINPTRKSVILMETIENATIIKGNSDQVLWNQVIR